MWGEGGASGSWRSARPRARRSLDPPNDQLPDCATDPESLPVMSDKEAVRLADHIIQNHFGPLVGVSPYELGAHWVCCLARELTSAVLPSPSLAGRCL